MDYPWKEVVVTETPVFKDHKIVISEMYDNCTIRVIECIQNDPDVCMAEYFVHIIWTRGNKEMYNEECLGPYCSPELKNLFKVFGLSFSVWEKINFNR